MVVRNTEKPPSSDSSTRGGCGRESIPCMEWFRLEEAMVLPREEPDTWPTPRLFRWRGGFDLSGAQSAIETEEVSDETSNVWCGHRSSGEELNRSVVKG